MGTLEPSAWERMEEARALAIHPWGTYGKKKKDIKKLAQSFKFRLQWHHINLNTGQT